MSDKSNGYESIAADFVRARNSSIGPQTVRAWAKRLQPGTSILDLGCGFGVISEALLSDGFSIYGVDASETLVAKFRERFPTVSVECNSVEESSLFNRTFDAVVIWGLMFLLTADAQRNLIRKVAGALNRNGHFLFTAPKEVCTWDDAMTGLRSISLGHEVYERELSANNLQLVGVDKDEGENYYYFATLTAPSGT